MTQAFTATICADTYTTRVGHPRSRRGWFIPGCEQYRELLAVVASLVASPAIVSAQTYTITEIPPVQDNQNTSVATINESGVVVGTSAASNGSNFWGWVYRPGVGSARIRRFLADDPQNSGSYGRGINSMGQLVGGSAMFASGYQMALLSTAISPGSTTALGWFSGGGSSDAWSINDSGVIVGWGDFSLGCGGPLCPSNPGRACRWMGTSTIEALPTLGGYGNIATGNNNNGDIVGIDGFLPNPDYMNTRAFILPGGLGPAIELVHPFIPHGASRAFKIKDSGVILGFALNSLGISKPVRWLSPTSATVLATVPDLPHAAALDALPAGAIVIGTAHSGPLNNGGNGGVLSPIGGTAMLFVRGRAVNLNTAIAQNSGWNLRIANGITSQGVIAGEGDLGPNHRGYVLTPCGPLIYNPPISARPCGLQAASFTVASVNPATGNNEPTTIQWRVELPAGSGTYVNLTNGAFAEPATGLMFTASGVTSGQLTITGVTLASHSVSIRFAATMTNACGSATSPSATLTICVADTDDGSGTGTCDGGVTIDDLLYYLRIFEEGQLAADVDDGSGRGSPDGGVTIDDLLYYLVRFEAEC